MTLFPDMPLLLALRGHYRLGQEIPELRDYELALRDFDRAIEADPSLAFAYVRRALLHDRENRLAEALADAEMGIQLKPGHPAGYLMRARALKLQGDLLGATSNLATAKKMTIGSASWDAYYYQCEAALEAKAYAEVKASCLEAFRLNEFIKHATFMRRGLIEAYVGFGELDAARALIAEAGNKYEQVSMASALTPEDVPAEFNLRLFEEIRGAMYYVLDRKDLGKLHRVKAGIEVGFDRAPSGILNWVTIYLTEEDAVKGFAFQSDKDNRIRTIARPLCWLKTLPASELKCCG